VQARPTIARMLPASGAWTALPAWGRAARELPVERAKRSIATTLWPCATASSAAIELDMQNQAGEQDAEDGLISVPTERAARICARCRGSACSGNADRRP